MRYQPTSIRLPLRHNTQYGQPWLQSFNTSGGSQVFVERDGSGTPLGLHIAAINFSLVLDNLGSVIAVVSTSGNVVARYSYDPYRTTVSVDESGLSQPNIVRYTGGALDQTTGLTKLGDRYYDPATGTFTQQDAFQLLANPQNGNLYAYAGDNPANSIDPSWMKTTAGGGCGTWDAHCYWVDALNAGSEHYGPAPGPAGLRGPGRADRIQWIRQPAASAD